MIRRLLFDLVFFLFSSIFFRFLLSSSHFVEVVRLSEWIYGVGDAIVGILMLMMTLVTILWIALHDWHCCYSHAILWMKISGCVLLWLYDLSWTCDRLFHYLLLLLCYMLIGGFGVVDGDVLKMLATIWWIVLLYFNFFYCIIFFNGVVVSMASNNYVTILK